MILQNHRRAEDPFTVQDKPVPFCGTELETVQCHDGVTDPALWLTEEALTCPVCIKEHSRVPEKAIKMALPCSATHPPAAGYSMKTTQHHTLNAEADKRTQLFSILCQH